MTAADVVHEDRTDSMAVHAPQYADLCPTCQERAKRGRHITAFHRSLVEFGYSTLTREEVADAYDAVIRGESRDGDIIRMLIGRQLDEASA